MIAFNFNTNYSIKELSDDENLVPAIDFINQWNNGATAFTFKSSGSTGNAKDIVLSKTFLIQSAKRTIDLFKITSEDHLLLALNTSFMGGIMMVVRALVARCTLIYIPPQHISTKSITDLPPIILASFVPAQIQKIIYNTSEDPFMNITNILIGGAPVSDSLGEDIRNSKTSCTFYQTYGMTETASHVALKNISTNDKHYTALEGYSFDTDEKNQLIIQYHIDPKFTLQTQDIVNLHSVQSFEWIGRTDWVVNSGGIKFSLETAENTVSNFFKNRQDSPLITSYKEPDEKWGERWILILACNALSQAEEALLIEFCKTNLGKYVYPKEIRYSKKTVYLPSGKIDRINTYKASL